MNRSINPNQKSSQPSDPNWAPEPSKKQVKARLIGGKEPLQLDDNAKKPNKLKQKARHAGTEVKKTAKRVAKKVKVPQKLKDLATNKKGQLAFEDLSESPIQRIKNPASTRKLQGKHAEEAFMNAATDPKQLGSSRLKAANELVSAKLKVEALRKIINDKDIDPKTQKEAEHLLADTFGKTSEKQANEFIHSYKQQKEKPANSKPQEFQETREKDISDTSAAHQKTLNVLARTIDESKELSIHEAGERLVKTLTDQMPEYPTEHRVELRKMIRTLRPLITNPSQSASKQIKIKLNRSLTI